MARITPTQKSFSSGEWAPSLYARDDLEGYNSASKRLLNWMLHRHGGVSTRPGTYFVGEVEDSAAKVRLIPFMFSETESYILVLGDKTMRVIKGYEFTDVHVGDTFDAASGWNNDDLCALSGITGVDIARGSQVYAKNGLYVEGNATTRAAIVVDGVTVADTLYISADDDHNYLLGSICPPTVLKNVSGDFDLACRANLVSGPAMEAHIGIFVNAHVRFSHYYDGNHTHAIEAGRTGAAATLATTTHIAHWLRIKRVGNALTCYWSADTSTLTPAWTQIYTTSAIALGIEMNFGMYVDNPDTSSATNVVGTFGEINEVADSFEFHTVVSPYAVADLPRLRLTQTADTIYVTHPTYPVYKIKRVSENNWSITAVTFGTVQTPPTSPTRSGTVTPVNHYAVTAISATGEESVPLAIGDAGVGDTIGWTAPATIGASYYAVYGDPGGASGFYGWIADTASNSWIVQNIYPDWEASPPAAKTVFSGANNYPGACAFFEQRLVLARTNTYPHTVFGSAIGRYENFNTSHAGRADEAYEWTLDSRRQNEILWMVPMGKLLLGTTGNEWRMDGGSGSDTITPTSVNARVQSAWGCANIEPLVVGNTLLFVTAGGTEIRELAYSLESDSFDGFERTILANHLFLENPIVDWCYQRAPYSTVWCVLTDGSLVGMTYLREHKVWGWHKHTTDGLFENVCVVPDGTGKDVLYMVVKRTINSATRRYVEILQDMEWNDPDDAFYVDSGLTLDRQIEREIDSIAKTSPGFVTTVLPHGLSTGDVITIDEVEGMTEINGLSFLVDAAGTGAYAFYLHNISSDADYSLTAFSAYADGGVVRKHVTSVTGLAHLEGETVSVLADGGEVKGLVVSGGAITLPVAAAKVHVGLPYVCDLETLDFSIANETQTTADKKRRIVSAMVRLDSTGAMKIGPDATRLVEVPFRIGGYYDSHVDLFSGEKVVDLKPGDSMDSRIFVRVDSPLPCTVLSITPRFDVGGE
jgi:hypothetical protein